MSGNPNAIGRLRPLSIGNVVSAGARLYRSHFKTYLKLALFAYLWLLIPIYGWAKYFAISGLIARLAFGELTNHPESVKTARQQVNRRLWSFLRLAVLIGWLFIGVYLGIAIAMGILWVAMFFIAVSSLAGTIAITTLIIVILAIGLISIIWLVSRLLLPEVPLAIETDITVRQSIARSWALTKAVVLRVIGIVVVASLITLPIVLLMSIIPDLLISRLEPGTTVYSIVFPVLLILRIVSGIFVLPFWQAIKATLYYDLRSRKEGLDLQLRNPNSV
ncbi:MAG: hypothetical protein MJA27_08740 [Pseudanabaenales cyanobacterium]|nr:hypothetical protein [Pseudanabaenales cyanobacterium]